VSFGAAPVREVASAAKVLDRAETAMLAARSSRPGRSDRAPAAARPARLDIAGGLLALDVDAHLGEQPDFDDLLQREWALARRHETDAVVIVAGITAQVEESAVDVDELTGPFGEALRVATRGTDVVARIGSGEFAVLLVGCDASAASHFECRLRAALTEPSWPDLASLELSVGRSSVGEAASAPDALARAEQAMRAAAAGQARPHRRGLTGRSALGV
jgi:hypothetical protein